MDVILSRHSSGERIVGFQVIEGRKDLPCLTPDDMNQLIAAAKKTGRYPLRDSTFLLIMYRHGLRGSEASLLEWKDVDFASRRLAVKWLSPGKEGDPNHPLEEDEATALEQLRKEYPNARWVFHCDEAPLGGGRGEQDILSRAVEEAGLSFPFRLNFHTIPYSTRSYLVSKGLGEEEIENYLGKYKKGVITFS